jgi:hypothetical protein
MNTAASALRGWKECHQSFGRQQVVITFLSFRHCARPPLEGAEAGDGVMERSNPILYISSRYEVRGLLRHPPA